MKNRQIASFNVSAIGLGCMNLSHAYGSPVSAEQGERVLLAAFDHGVNFFDTAALYGFGANETLVGKVLKPHRQKFTLASKCGMQGVEQSDGSKVRVIDGRPETIKKTCEDALRRLQTDVIDLYQIHWPTRAVPMFGAMYYQPADETSLTSMHAQLEALGQLVQAGKVRAVGLSNETPYGVHEFVRLAEQHGLPRVATVQNVYSLISRTVENGLDETLHRLGVSLLAYSPLAFGLLTGKYDASGITGPEAPAQARIAKYASVRKQRWGRPESLAAAKRYNALARANGLTPTQMALAFCYTKWQVASTIIGVTSVAQLDENIAALGTTLAPETLAAIDSIRLEMRDPAC
jgi:aryl-alcohol dehydrogenase-like predicted oxidoreductase